MARLRILCLGNELVRDDGVGVRAGRLLRELPLPEGVEVELRRAAGMDLLDLFGRDEALLVVDAMCTGGAPGAVKVLSLDAVEALSDVPSCCHAVGISEVLRLGRRLAEEGVAPPPGQVTLVGVEVEALDSYGTELSPHVREALPRLVEAVLEVAGAPEALCRRGVELALERKGWDPGPEEL